MSPRSDVDTSTPATSDTHTPTTKSEHLIDYSAGQDGRGGGLRVFAAAQWVHATTGRIATCAHSWMQAVHWVAGSGLYTPSRTHGPKWGPTTIAIAQEIADQRGCVVVPSYDDPRIIAGQGTVGLEIAEDAARLDTVLVAAGGGGRHTLVIRQ